MLHVNPSAVPLAPGLQADSLAQALAFGRRSIPADLGISDKIAGTPKPQSWAKLSFASAPVTITGATYTVTDWDVCLIANRAGTVTLTLPDPASWKGRQLVMKTITANTVVSDASNVAPVDSATAGMAILAATAGKWAALVSDGTNWVTMAAN